MQTRRTTVLVGIVAAGLVLTQQACTPGEQSEAPVAFTAPTPAASATQSTGGKKTTAATPAKKKTSTAAPAGSKTSGDPILAGKRRVVIKPVPGYESIVVVDAKGKLSLSDIDTDNTLFVLSPVGGKYQIKAADGSCMGVKSSGSASLTVVAASCDSGRDGQLFTIDRQKKKDEGLPTYAISNRGAFLQESTSGLIAQELGDAPLPTTFSFVDNGPAN